MRKILVLIATVSLCLISSKHLYGGDAGLTISRFGKGAKGDVIYRIVAHNTPNEVEAFGFDVSYDPKALQYRNVYRKGSLLRGFQFFDVNEVSPGHLRVGGFTLARPIPTGKSGTMVVLRFKAIGDASKAEAEMEVKDVVDHMANWLVSSNKR